MSKIFEQIVKIRNLDESFLHPKYENCTDPAALPDIDKAVGRLKQAIQEREKILIFGDYDVDGVTASTVMEETLLLAGSRPEDISIMLPDRFADGYGMSPKIIKYAQKQGVSLVITVDCGSQNHAIINELNTLKIDTIVTDHHETPSVLPEATAIINPKRQDFHNLNGLKNLAGVGVAFKLTQALVKAGLIKKGQEKWLLDLVLLGTICDNMTLTGENRILGFYGMKVLAKTRRSGLRELLKTSGVKKITSEAVGFQIGPRLNAAGRLDTADISLNLLRTKSSVEATALAAKLELLNKKRKAEQLSASKEIKIRGISDDPVIIETGNWHEGILGIIAGHLVEDYKRPAFVLTETNDHIFKGSARSFGDFNLADALNYAKNSILSGGGHAAAAGVKVDRAHLFQFREQINEYYRSLNLSNQDIFLKQHADLDLSDFSELNLNLLEELKQLEPYGAGNEEPIFRLKNTNIANTNKIGSDQNHLRLELTDKTGKFLKLIAFYAPKTWLDLNSHSDKIEPLVRLIENDWNGVKSLEARIVDLGINH